MTDDIISLIWAWWENTIDTIVDSMLKEDDYVEYCIEKFDTNSVRCSKEKGCSCGDELLDNLCGDVWLKIALEEMIITDNPIEYMFI